MLIPYSLYIIIAGLLVVFFIARGTYLNKRFNKSWTFLPVVIVIGLVIMANIYLPIIYNIPECGKCTKQVMIFPKKVSNIELEYGNHCYVNNQSSHQLGLESVVYGNVTNNKNLQTLISLVACVKVPVHSINYLFKEPPRSITINDSNGGEVKYWLFCIDAN